MELSAQNLVGRHFNIDEADYAIVDVRNINGEVMVYAEPASGARGPGRAAFRYTDIETRLSGSPPAVA